MITNYIKIAFRNLLRFRFYSFINIAGLALGISASVIIGLYVFEDLTFDSCFPDSDKVYRLLTVEKSGKGEMIYSIMPGPLAAGLPDAVPEIIAGTRTFSFGNVRLGIPGKEDDAETIRGRSFVTDTDFWETFGVKIIEGGEDNPLDAPEGFYITRELGERLFGEENPVGKSIIVRGFESPYIAGIVETLPTNNHLSFDLLIPLKPERNPVWWDNWENLMLSGYIKVDRDVDVAQLESKINDWARPQGLPDLYTIRLQPLDDVHLGSADHQYDYMNRGSNDRNVVYTLAAIAIMILLVASINFINLASARASHRAKETGLRKVVGSGRGNIIAQYLGESTFLTIISFVFAMIIVAAVSPYITGLLGRNLMLDLLFSWQAILSLFLAAVFLGALSGIYPALIISGFKPVMVLKGDFHTSRAGILIRRFLVIFQFAITISLFIGVLLVHIQVEYLQEVDMGYSRDNVMITGMPREVAQVFIDRASGVAGVEHIGRTTSLPGTIFTRIEVIPQGFDRQNSFMFPWIIVDDKFAETMKIKTSIGRDFSVDFPSDTVDACIINETAFKLTGWDDPIGKRIEMIDVNGNPVMLNVIGVYKDFHFSSPRQEMEPMFFTYQEQANLNLLIKIGGSDTESITAKLEKIYSEIDPENNFNFIFMEDFYNRQFNNERDFAANIGYFSLFAIIIALLGLVGLVSFGVEQRRKEIAIRKVIGCSEGKIIMLLSYDFLKWVVVANLLAWPFSYFAMGIWSSEFVYQAPLKLWPYLVSGISALVIAFLTISVQSIRAARANPVKSIRYE